MNSPVYPKRDSIRAYPGRDTARLIRRARSIMSHHTAANNQRARCCHKPDPREVPDAAVLTTRCANCGAVV
jgi:hypothetical protein